MRGALATVILTLTVAVAAVAAPSAPDVLESTGIQGGLTVHLGCGDGKRLAEHKLGRPPVVDGMIAAGGRLHIATMDGRVVCMAGD